VCCVPMCRWMGNGKRITHSNGKENQPMTQAETAAALGVTRKTLYSYRQNPTFPAKGSVAEMRHWVDTHAGTVTAPRSGTPRTQPPPPPGEELLDQNWHARYTRARALEKESKLPEAEVRWLEDRRAELLEEVKAIHQPLYDALHAARLPADLARRVNAALKTALATLDEKANE